MNPDSPGDPHTPTSTLGPYRLERLLGRGTMASVYLARHERDGLVAIKRLHTLASTEDQARLRREAETMAALHHPNIMSVLDVIRDGDGIAIVLPFAEGGSLSQRIAQGPLKPDELLAILGPISEALDTAHRSHILHRDVKPSNILFDHTGAPLLADFGIASNAAHTNLTRTDVAIGTAGYLDPEVADGGEPDSSADLYALGVVAYEALAGKPPYVGATPLAVLRAADLADPKPISNVGPAIDHVVRRAFARHRSDRFDSVGHFVAAFRSAVAAPNAIPETLTTNTSSSLDRDDIPVEGTAAFRRRVPDKALQGATPVAPSKRRLFASIATGVAMAAMLVGAFVYRNSRDATLAALPIPDPPKCSPETLAQCVQKTLRTPNGVRVEFANGTSAEYRLGATNDPIRVANYFCGERATLALYEYSTGRLFYLSNWPDPASNENTEGLVDETGIVGAQISIADHNGDKCADIALDRNGTRTWFLPKVQTRRLSPAKLDVTYVEAS